MKMAHDDLMKIATGQGGDHRTGHLLCYPYLKEHFKIISIDLSKQQILDANYRAIQQIYFTANPERAAGATVFLVLEGKNNFC